MHFSAICEPIPILMERNICKLIKYEHRPNRMCLYLPYVTMPHTGVTRDRHLRYSVKRNKDTIGICT